MARNPLATFRPVLTHPRFADRFAEPSEEGSA